MKKSGQKGFTLIELLVVIAIIGILSTLAVVALNSARQKSRDSKRVADVKQMQTSLDLYFSDQNEYPPDIEAITGCAAGVVGCDGTGDDADEGTTVLCRKSPTEAGWYPAGDIGACEVVYMGLIPSAPEPHDGDCLGFNDYTYTRLADGADYTVDFCVGNGVGSLPAGTLRASAAGIQAYTPEE